MKLLKLFKNQSGVTLLESMVAVSILSVISLTVASLLKDAGEGVKTNEAKSEITGLKNILLSNFTDTAACTNTFGSYITQANLTAATGSGLVTIAFIKDKLNNPTYSTASTNVRPLTITGIYFTNYVALAGTADLLVKTTFQKSSTKVINLKDIRVPLNMSISGTAALPTLSSCSTMAIGDDWMLAGNAGTTDGTDYIGTSDNVPLNFRVNAQPSGRIDSIGQTFFGFESGKNFNPAYTSGTGFGYEALKSQSAWNGTTGNSAFGTGTLKSVVTASYNTAIGWNALVNNYMGYYETAVGAAALAYHTSGSSNTALGYQAMKYLSSGSSNLALGGNSGYFNTAGNYNTYVGEGSAPLLKSGSNNIFLGYGAGAGVFNSSNKLYIESTNYAIPLITADFSSAARSITLNGSTTVNSSTGVASGSALTVNMLLAHPATETAAIYAYHNATAVTDVAVGLRAQARNPVYGSTGRLYGVKASAGGGAAGLNYGVWAYTEGGGAGLFASEDSTPPNAVYTYDGWGMMWAAIFKGKVLMTTDLYLKNYLSVSGGAGFGTTVWMGQHLNVSGTVNISTGLNVAGIASKTGGGLWATTSDRRLKKNIKDLGGALEKISKLRPVKYDWKRPQGSEKIVHDTGFIAQDVEKFFPEWVTEKETSGDDLLLIPKNEKTKVLSLTTGFFAYMVKAIQELNEELTKNMAMLKMMQEGLEQKVEANSKAISILEKEVSSLKRENEDLRERLERIEKKLLK